MIRRLKITLLVVLCSLAVAAAYIVWPRTVPFSECSELYQRYADNEHVAASFVRNYRVNDTLTLDVTLLQATDSAGWQQLIEDFNIHILDAIQKEVDENRDIVTSRKIPANPADSTDNRKYVMAITYLNRNICIFHTQNNGQFKAVLHRNFEQGNI